METQWRVKTCAAYSFRTSRLAALRDDLLLVFLRGYADALHHLLQEEHLLVLLAAGGALGHIQVYSEAQADVQLHVGQVFFADLFGAALVG